MNKKIDWCCTQRDGLHLIESKQHLSEAYYKEAIETLKNVHTTTGKWKLIMAYYACYNALYALLMKCGVKCEIHDCSLALMPLFEFSASELAFMKQLKEDRIQTQYYLKNIELKDEQPVKEFISHCETLLITMTSETMENIRDTILRAKKGESQ